MKVKAIWLEGDMICAGLLTIELWAKLIVKHEEGLARIIAFTMVHPSSELVLAN